MEEFNHNWGKLVCCKTRLLRQYTTYLSQIVKKRNPTQNIKLQQDNRMKTNGPL